MTHKITVEEANFQNGEPTCQYDEIYKCFTNNKNGLLFRLVNTEKKEWHFYNDTSDTIMKVNVIFGPGSNITPLRRARLTHIPKDDGTIDEMCEQRVTLEVDPYRTEGFIQGTPNGFRMEFNTEAAAVTRPSFEFRKPTVPYTKVYKCFKNNGNGLLFRLVNETSKTWHFYNDTKTYTMMVNVEFDHAREVKELGSTVRKPAPSDKPDGVVLYLEIAPGKTEAFLEGEPTAFRLGFSAEPVNNERAIDPSELAYENGKPNDAIVSPSAHAYKCFKNNGNGLLFRLVDDKKGIWAFYNDTVEYVMKAMVRFPQGEEFEAAEGTVCDEDPERPGITLVTMEIPPLETQLFLTGAPKNFEVAFTAEGVNNAAPSEVPEYENGEPDRRVIQYQRVFRCFKNNGNGLLFRLVDDHGARWGFYNDTKDLLITAEVEFDENSAIRALDTTECKTIDGTKAYTISVPPGLTHLFIEGDVSGFRSKFSAKRVSAADANAEL